MQALKPIISRVAISGHPLHPVLIHFPVAALLGLIATDAAFLLTRDFFWDRAGIWLAGVGAAGAAFSSVAGLLDMILVRQIRRLVMAWCHAVMAVMLLSLASLNWLLRYSAIPDSAVIPWGIYLSCLTGVLVAITGFLGGQLVYEYGVGVDLEEAASKNQAA